MTLHHHSYHDSVEDGSRTQTYHAWMKECWKEINYLLALTGIAILWKPNSNARQYVHSFENSSTYPTNVLNVQSSSKSSSNGGQTKTNRLLLNLELIFSSKTKERYKDSKT
jgi:hypothetical protein